MPEAPFSDDERHRLRTALRAMPSDEEWRQFRELLEAQRRAAWFWATSRTIAMWLAAMFAGWVALKTFLSDFVRSIG